MLRADKAAAAGASTARAINGSRTSGVPRVVFAYASQTGMSQEIARNLHAEAVEKGYKAEVRCNISSHLRVPGHRPCRHLPLAQVMALTELGLPALTAEKTPILVVVSSSTGACTE